MQEIIQQVGALLVGAIPTAVLFIVLVGAYQLLVQGPLTETLKKRRELTLGAMEDARRGIEQAEARTAEYADKLRQARADTFRLREQRVKQWGTERDAALDAARKAAGAKVSHAKAEVEAEAASARQAIQASAADLAGLAVRAVLPVAAGGFPLKYSIPQPRLLARFFRVALLAVLAVGCLFAVARAAAQQPAPASNSAAAPADNEDNPTTPGDEQKELNIFRHAPLVAKIGQKMGMDVETTARVFEAINFAIIILAIVIPIVRIVPRTLRQRSETLNHDIQTAREATADANARLSAVEAQLAGLDAEIQKFRAQVEQESREDEKRIKAAIEEESARIVAAAEQEIAMAAAQARRGLRHFAADLAIEQAEKQMVLTPETDHALIAEFIGDVANRGSGHGAGNGARNGSGKGGAN